VTRTLSRFEYFVGQALNALILLEKGDDGTAYEAICGPNSLEAKINVSKAAVRIAEIAEEQCQRHDAEIFKAACRRTEPEVSDL